MSDPPKSCRLGGGGGLTPHELLPTAGGGVPVSLNVHPPTKQSALALYTLYPHTHAAWVLVPVVEMWLSLKCQRALKL